MGMNLPGLPVGPLGETLTTGHLCSAGLFPQASRLRGSRGTPPGEAHQSGCALAINPLTRSWPPPDPQQALSFQEGLPDWTVRCGERQEGPGPGAAGGEGLGRHRLGSGSALPLHPSLTEQIPQPPAAAGPMGLPQHVLPQPLRPSPSLTPAPSSVDLATDWLRSPFACLRNLKYSSFSSPWGAPRHPQHPIHVSPAARPVFLLPWLFPSPCLP